jgi:transposase
MRLPPESRSKTPVTPLPIGALQLTMHQPKKPLPLNMNESRRQSGSRPEFHFHVTRRSWATKLILYQRPRRLTHGGGDSQRARFLTPLAREIRAMPSAVRLREDYLAEELRALARRSKNVNQSRRLLSLAAVRDGMDRGAAAKIGGMDRQTLRDWVHRFNALGPGGLFDNWTEGPKPRLSEAQLAQFAKVVEAGPDREIDGVVRWRGIDLKRVIGEKFGVDFHPRYVGKLLKKLGFSHISARPRHPAQDERIVEAFKKTSRAR